MVVEHSAILISKILKASNGHFSFDGWYKPVPAPVVSQQWPDPADPRRGEMKAVGISDGLWSDLRDDAFFTFVKGLSPTTKANKEASCQSHYKKGTKGNKWHQSPN